MRSPRFTIRCDPRPDSNVQPCLSSHRLSSALVTLFALDNRYVLWSTDMLCQPSAGGGQNLGLSWGQLRGFNSAFVRILLL